MPDGGINFLTPQEGKSPKSHSRKRQRMVCFFLFSLPSRDSTPCQANSLPMFTATTVMGEERDEHLAMSWSEPLAFVFDERRRSRKNHLLFESFRTVK